MPRVSRESCLGKCNHILLESKPDLIVFNNNEKKSKFLEFISIAVKSTNVKLIAYCIMDSHAHLIIGNTNATELSSFMSHICISYAKYYNKNYKHSGKIFDGRYISQPIDDMRALVNCIYFVHSNPVIAGLCDKAIEYAYSSYEDYITEGLLIDYDYVNSLIGDIDPKIVKKLSVFKAGVWRESLEYMDSIIDSVVKETIKSSNISNIEQLNDKKNILLIANALIDKCGLSIRQAAQKLEIGRETLRKMLVE